MAHQPDATAIGAALRAACALGNVGRPGAGGGGAASELGARESLVELLCVVPEALRSCDAEGNSPLHLAAQRGLTEVSRLLVAAGAVVNMTNGQGQTPATLAASFGHAELASTLAAAAVGTGHTGGSSAYMTGGGQTTGLSSSLPAPLAPLPPETHTALKPKAQLPPVLPPLPLGLTSADGSQNALPGSPSLAPIGGGFGTSLATPAALAPLGTTPIGRTLPPIAGR